MVKCGSFEVFILSPLFSLIICVYLVLPKQICEMLYDILGAANDTFFFFNLKILMTSGTKSLLFLKYC